MGIAMITFRQATILAAAALLTGALTGCDWQSTYSALENDHDQLNQRPSGEISQQQVHITRLQGAIKVAVNSELRFPSGGWQMPPEAAQTIAKMASILAPFQPARVIVTGYTDNVPVGPDLQHQGIQNNQQLLLKRAQVVMQFLSDTDAVASNDTPQGTEPSSGTYIGT
jgi:chemotaxis protein MotB